MHIITNIISTKMAIVILGEVDVKRGMAPTALGSVKATARAKCIRADPLVARCLSSYS